MIKDRLEKNKDYILQSLRDGKSTLLLAMEFNCNSGYIYLFAKEYGIGPRIKRSKIYGKKEQFIQEIIERFNGGESAYSISKDMKINKKTLLRWLRQEGIDTSRDLKLDPNKPTLKSRAKEAIQLYKSGYTQQEIAKKMGYSDSQICRILQKNNVDIRPINKYTYDMFYFDKIDSIDKAYFLGLYYADGATSHNKLRISLQEKDIKVLEEAVRQFKYTGPLTYRQPRNLKHYGQYTLCIARQEIYEQICNLGAGLNKTFKIRFPYQHINKSLYAPFLAGFTMGDGSVSKSGHWSITSNYDFINDIINILPCNISGIYQRYKERDIKDSSHMLYIGKREDYIILYKWLYNYDCSYFKYDRKYQLAQKIINNNGV